MPIDQFYREDFEKALPVHKETGDPLWYHHGLVTGEHEYVIPVMRGNEEDDILLIIVRSSIDNFGIAADCGEDSIRMWIEGYNLADQCLEPLGKGAGRWTTRVKGWQDRMTEKLRELYKVALKLEKCPACGNWKHIYRVKKDGPNKGRRFAKCPICENTNTFEWMN